MLARSLVYFPRRSMRRRCVTPPVRQRTSRSSRSAVPDILSPDTCPMKTIITDRIRVIGLVVMVAVMVNTRPVPDAASIIKQPSVLPPVCLSRQSAAAAGEFAAEVGRGQHISIDSCCCRATCDLRKLCFDVRRSDILVRVRVSG